MAAHLAVTLVRHHQTGGDKLIPYAPAGPRNRHKRAFARRCPSRQSRPPMPRQSKAAGNGANAAWGQHYSREFSKWMKAHSFDRMLKSTRSVAIELHENANTIEASRATLPERQRKRLVHPLSNVRRWRASLNHGNGKCPADLKRDAAAAWRRFVSCVRLLPADQAGHAACRKRTVMGA